MGSIGNYEFVLENTISDDNEPLITDFQMSGEIDADGRKFINIQTELDQGVPQETPIKRQYVRILGPEGTGNTDRDQFVLGDDGYYHLQVALPLESPDGEYTLSYWFAYDTALNGVNHSGSVLEAAGYSVTVSFAEGAAVAIPPEIVDSDADGTTDFYDLDDDNDGVADKDDAFPLDGAESLDTDADGVGNNEDTDDDGDGFTDDHELGAGSDPLDPGSTPTVDGGFLVGKWIVPSVSGSIGAGPTEFDVSYWTADESAIAASECFYDDEYIFNADGSFSINRQGETWLRSWQPGVESDGCGAPVAPYDNSIPGSWFYDQENQLLTIFGQGSYIGWAAAVNGTRLDFPSDSDNDGVPDEVIVPDSIVYKTYRDENGSVTFTIESSPDEWWTIIIEPVCSDSNSGPDWDFDGLADSCDPDDDNDGVIDLDDAFPFDDTESLDTDQDGVGNNADDDDDDDGILDADDRFPLIAGDAAYDIVFTGGAFGDTTIDESLTMAVISDGIVDDPFNLRVWSEPEPGVDPWELCESSEECGAIKWTTAEDVASNKRSIEFTFPGDADYYGEVYLSSGLPGSWLPLDMSAYADGTISFDIFVESVGNQELYVALACWDGNGVYTCHSPHVRLDISQQGWNTVTVPLSDFTGSNSCCYDPLDFSQIGAGLIFSNWGWTEQSRPQMADKGDLIVRLANVSWNAGPSVFTHPQAAESWGGFANTDPTIYPITLPGDATISFTGSVPSEEAVDVRFRFEFNSWPDIEPSYDTSSVTVSGAADKIYTIEVPSQGANTFSSFLMYLDTKDVGVSITNIGIAVAETPEVTNDDDN